MTYIDKHLTIENCPIDLYRELLGLVADPARSGALDKPLVFTVFPTQYADTKTENVASLRELARRIQQENAADKKALPFLKLVRFGDDPNENNCLRTNANMKAVSGVEVDYDKGSLSIEEARQRLEKSGVAALLYETASSRPDFHKWRCLCPLSGELSPDERHNLVARLNGLFDGALDPASFTASQSFYFGGVRGQRPRVELVEGDYLDIANHLDATAIGRRERSTVVARGEKTGLSVMEFRNAVMAIPNDGSPEQNASYDWWRDILAAIHYEADGSDVGLTIALEWSEQWPGFNKKETRDTYGSFQNRVGQPNATGFKILSIAKDHGWRDPTVADEFEDLPAIDRSSSDNLIVAKNGKPFSNLANAITLLRRIDGLIAYDEMQSQVVLRRRIPPEKGKINPRPLKDEDATALCEHLQRRGLPTLSTSITHDALRRVAVENDFHPIRDELRSLKWDGKPRLGTWLVRYLGAPDSEYAHAVGRMFLIQMVARVMQPGCKADYTPILEGAQGEQKSTIGRILAGKAYFSDSLPSLSKEKDAMSHLRGTWLLELPELAHFRKSEREDIKHYLTKEVDRFRPAYGRTEVEVPRQCVFFGTTNESEYLRDPTGNRRFWPVACKTIDTEALRRDRDQLFAEAVKAFNSGGRWWPDVDFEARVIRPEQEARFEEDAWTDRVQAYLDDYQRVTINDIAIFALGLNLAQVDAAKKRRIGDLLRRLGWRRKKSNGRWAYIRTPKVRGVRP